MNWIEQRLPFEEYKDRQLYLDFKDKTEQEIAEILDKEDSYTDYDESDEVLDSEGDEDWYDPMLLDYMLNKHEE
jgi:hypothetical protein